MKKTFVLIALATAGIFGANTALAQSRACQDVKSHAPFTLGYRF